MRLYDSMLVFFRMKYTRHLTNVSDEIKRSKSLKIKVLDNPIIHYSIHLEKRNKYLKKKVFVWKLKAI